MPIDLHHISGPCRTWLLPECSSMCGTRFGLSLRAGKVVSSAGFGSCSRKGILAELRLHFFLVIVGIYIPAPMLLRNVDIRINCLPSSHVCDSSCWHREFTYRRRISRSMAISHIGTNILILTGIFYALDVLAVTLRLYSRHLKRRALGPDDYSAIIALVRISFLRVLESRH